MTSLGVSIRGGPENQRTARQTNERPKSQRSPRDELERQAIARLLADLSPMAYEIALEKIRKVMEDKP